MPEFQLKGTESPVPLEFADLHPFTQGYIEALFFTSEGPGVTTEQFLTAEYQEDLREGRADGCLPGDVGFSDLHPKALESIMADCWQFQRGAAELLMQAYKRDYDPTQAGRDFWFTRNGDGVGYWDRPQLNAGRMAPEPDGLGDRLSELARQWGQVNPFFGNDHINPDSCVHLG